jgi:hypothetical protein
LAGVEIADLMARLGTRHNPRAWLFCIAGGGGGSAMKGLRRRQRPSHLHAALATESDADLAEWQRVVKLTIGRAGPTRLSFEQILQGQLPAIFVDYGEHILFFDGRVFDFGDKDRAHGLSLCPSVLDATLLKGCIGIEYGWRHADGCRCRFCVETEDLSTHMRLAQSSATQTRLSA